MKDILPLLLLGGGVWLAYKMGLFSSFGFGTATAPAVAAGPGGPVPQQTPPGSSTVITGGSTPAQPPASHAAWIAGLTLQDANTFLYSASIPPDQISSLHAALVTELQAGQVATIYSKSVLSYMLGWGGAQANGATKQTLGLTYRYSTADQSWHLVAANTNIMRMSGGATMPLKAGA